MTLDRELSFGKVDILRDPARNSQLLYRQSIGGT